MVLRETLEQILDRRHLSEEQASELLNALTDPTLAAGDGRRAANRAARKGRDRG